MIENESERLNSHAKIEEVLNQMTEMQQSHQHIREEYERMFKQIKQENDLLNQQIKQHLTESSSSSLTTNPPSEPTPIAQPEIFLYKYLNAWRDAFTELTIYIEERLKNNNRSSEYIEKVRRDSIEGRISKGDFFRWHIQQRRFNNMQIIFSLH